VGTIMDTDPLLYKDDSFFPIEIIYTDNGVTEIVNSPEDIESGRPFKVLETRVYGN
jgi:hypothetical protein